MIETQWPVLRVRSKDIFFKVTPVAKEDETFDIYIEQDDNKVLFKQGVSFEGMFDVLNSLAVAFGVLGFKVEHRF